MMTGEAEETSLSQQNTTFVPWNVHFSKNSFLLTTLTVGYLELESLTEYACFPDDVKNMSITLFLLISLIYNNLLMLS